MGSLVCGSREPQQDPEEDTETRAPRGCPLNQDRGRDGCSQSRKPRGRGQAEELLRSPAYGPPGRICRTGERPEQVQEAPAV